MERMKNLKNITKIKTFVSKRNVLRRTLVMHVRNKYYY